MAASLCAAIRLSISATPAGKIGSGYGSGVS
jgi:hypothetical protein